jgi:carboxypeptidase C (cathepsin A)
MMLLLVASFVLAVVAVPLEDDPNAANRITYLPGIDPQPPYAMYSGYIILDNGWNLFYWLFEAVENPDQAPLTLWLNGGKIVKFGV